MAERCPRTGTSLYLVLKSNGIHHSINLSEKFQFWLKRLSPNIAINSPQTISHSVLQHISQKAYVCFRRRKGVHIWLFLKNRTQRPTCRNRGLRFCGYSRGLSCRQIPRQKNSRRKRMHAYGVCPLPSAPRPRWAAQVPLAMC